MTERSTVNQPPSGCKPFASSLSSVHYPPERLSADLSARPVYTATPLRNCLNGCQRGTGPERAPVLCEGHDLLCRDCTKRLAKWLNGLPDTFGLLLWVRHHGSVPADPGSMHTKRPDPPAPMRLEVVDLLDQRTGRGVLDIVHSWADAVRDERRLPARCVCGHMQLGHITSTSLPWCSASMCDCTEYRPGRPTVTGECHLLAANLPWVVQQPWAGDMYDELQTLHRILADAVGDIRQQPITGGRHGAGCVAEAPDGGVCGGPLFQAGTGASTKVRCGRCGDTTTVERLQEMGLAVGLLSDDGRSRLEAS